MTGWALCVLGFTVLGWKFCCVLLGEVNHTKRRKEGKREKKNGSGNCHSELINQGEVYVLFWFFACVSQTCKEKKKRRQEVAFGGWPLNSCAYHRARWFSIGVAENTMIFSPLSRYFPETFEMNFARLKREMNCFFVFFVFSFRTLTGKFIRTRRSPAQKSSVLAVNFCRRNEKSSQSRIKGSFQAFMQQRRIGCFSFLSLFFFFFGFFLWGFLV